MSTRTKKRPIECRHAHQGAELLTNYHKRAGIIAHVRATYGVTKARSIETMIANIDECLKQRVK